MDVSEQLCYIPCNFCSIVLAVSVPCSSLFDVVTVRCGHCTNLWSVNMAAAAAFQSLPSWPQDAILQGLVPNHTSPEYKVDLGSSSSKWNNKTTIQPTSIVNKPEQRIVNPPPEKRQRVPSAYNQFIKEEIQRIKANNPEITHREAFSTAAKNGSGQKHKMRRAAFLNK
ncbi:hypothetical protein RD792_012064 [Penstemon davidsonii]|uniref:Uncharacterized protein n=1 Tax=Penstemon davidsonii TaxID=160366 RepID=A0ABR0CX98_9LAMI|nr:hypothetical protein RD792_012064 [Penstemon davidsonii]